MLMCCETLAICQKERGHEGKNASQRELAQRGRNERDCIVVNVRSVLKNDICTSSEQQDVCAAEKEPISFYLSQLQ